MRHRNYNKKLGRGRSHRRSMVKNMAASLILHEKVSTTPVKAKVVQSYVEKLITKGKPNTLTARRQLIQALPVKSKAVDKVLEVLSPKYKERHGGYTRIIKLGERPGDGSKTAIIEFV